MGPWAASGWAQVFGKTKYFFKTLTDIPYEGSKLGDMGLNKVDPNHTLKFENIGNTRIGSTNSGKACSIQ